MSLSRIFSLSGLARAGRAIASLHRIPPQGSVEHIRLRVNEVVPDGLEMQPADIFAAHVLAAITRAFFGHEARLDARRFDHQLLLAAALERDKPERGRFDTV